MRIDAVIDTLYTLGALGGMTGSSICPATPVSLSKSMYQVAPPTGVTAFVNVNVVPMDTERVLANHTVLVENGRITALGPTSKITVPTGAARIDGRGKYLMPGLADMHAHPVGTQDERAHSLFMALANGITTIRIMHNGATNSEPFRRLLTTAESPRPHAYFFPFLYEGIWQSSYDGRKTFPPPLDSLAGYLAGAKAAGFNYVLMPTRYMTAQSPQDREIRDSLLGIARRLKLPVNAHVHEATPAEVAMLGPNSGSTDHVYALWGALGGLGTTDVSASELKKLATAMQRAGVWTVVTLLCSEVNYKVVRSDAPSEHKVQVIKTIHQIIKALADAGAGLLLGLDGDGAPRESPSQIHSELAALVRVGLSPYQALLTGTRNVAQHLGILDSSGTVAVGKRADLVLLSGNPLVDIRYTREPVGVMIDGRWIDRATLDHGLLAFREHWFELEVESSLFFLPTVSYTGEQRVERLKWLKSQARKLSAMSDSVRLAQSGDGPAKYDQAQQRLISEFVDLRARAEASDQRETFDAMVRVWLCEQNRKGLAVAVPGITLTP